MATPSKFTAVVLGGGCTSPTPCGQSKLLRISSDSAERGGTLAGKFVKQLVQTATPFARDLALSADREQRFLYVGNRSQAKVMVLNRRTLEILDSFGQWGSAPGDFGTLHHMAADSKGNLYVTEVTPLKPENRRIQKFTRQ